MVPFAAWNVPLDKHCSQLAAQGSKAIKKSFPPPVLNAHGPHITQATLHRVAEIRSFKQQLRYLRRFRRIGNYIRVSEGVVDEAITAGVAFLSSPDRSRTLHVLILAAMLLI